jgi:hypothetical protein
LWAFEVGKDIAGLDKECQGGIGSAAGRGPSYVLNARPRFCCGCHIELLITENSSGKNGQPDQLEVENRSMRDDLGFFRRLIPLAAVRWLPFAVCRLKCCPRQLKWRVLVIQPVRMH